jgi:hypothetical protein
MSNYKTRHGKLIEDPMKIMGFITGGNSVFTIKNTKSGGSGDLQGSEARPRRRSVRSVGSDW